MRGTLSQHRCIGLLILLLGVFHSSLAQAYPWMIKHGFFNCGSCHTDVSGGETLTRMGRVEAEELLTWSAASPGEMHAYSQFLFGLREPEGIRLGGSYRHMLVYTAPKDGAASDLAQFPMQLDLYGSAHLGMLVLGGSIGVARGITGSANVRGAQINRELEEGWIALSRSHFIGVQLDPHTLLRAGRIALPFGLRIPEHVMWVRESTRTDRESDQQHGVALAYSDGPLRLELMGILGNFQIYPDRYRERGYSAFAELLVSPTGAVGVSSLLTFANEDRFTQDVRAVRQAHGMSARLGVSREWALLAEADFLKEGRRGWGGAGLVQTDYEPLRGLHLLLTGEVVDSGALPGGIPRSPGNGHPRFGGWVSVDLHFYSHFELRVDLVQRQESPLSLQTQFHMFL
ncbi:MAG TPA: hypothetical protein VJU61_00255 [Polyangiaceae bacterium]|nr:hypothetical protein [Polyangiaceae bacterium]